MVRARGVQAWVDPHVLRWSLENILEEADGLFGDNEKGASYRQRDEKQGDVVFFWQSIASFLFCQYFSDVLLRLPVINDHVGALLVDNDQEHDNMIVAVLWPRVEEDQFVNQTDDGPRMPFLDGGEGLG